MKLILSGCNGFVGAALYPKLLAAGHEVYRVDTQWFHDAPVDWQDIRKLKDLHGAECIIHLAAISNDPSVSYYPRRSWETGPLACQQLAQRAAKTGCRFIFGSSVSVYGADRGMVTEDMWLDPISDYNSQKMVAERVLLSYPEIKPQIVRPATICGLSPRMRLDLTVNMFTMQALTKNRMTVHGGSQWRPSIHIDDMCDLYLWMLDHPEHTGIWNAGFENHTLMTIAEMIQAATEADIEVTPQRDARSYQVNSDKLLQAGFKPKKTIANAIGELIEAYDNHELHDLPEWYNLGWMQTLGVQDA